MPIFSNCYSYFYDNRQLKTYFSPSQKSSVPLYLKHHRPRRLVITCKYTTNTAGEGASKISTILFPRVSDKPHANILLHKCNCLHQAIVHSLISSHLRHCDLYVFQQHSVEKVFAALFTCTITVQP